MSGSFRLEEAAGIVFIRCEEMTGALGLAHGFSTRRADGEDGFDLGGALAGDEATAERRRRFLEAAGLAGEPAVVRQVHGARVVVAGVGPDVPEADGVVWVAGQCGARVPSVRTADCVPVLLADREGRAAAAVHAGWRGTAARVVQEAVRALSRHGVPARRLLAALGPAILPCCYEVGADVAGAVVAASEGAGGATSRAGRRSLDLQAANRAQLVAAGVPTEAIHLARLCTACRRDLFFSYRRDGPAAGRMMASVGPSRGARAARLRRT